MVVLLLTSVAIEILDSGEKIFCAVTSPAVCMVTSPLEDMSPNTKIDAAVRSAAATMVLPVVIAPAVSKLMEVPLESVGCAVIILMAALDAPPLFTSVPNEMPVPLAAPAMTLIEPLFPAP